MIKRKIQDFSLPDKDQIAQNIRPMVKSTNGRRVLRSLFYETVANSTIGSETTEPIFTLKAYNVQRGEKTFWSLKNIYFSYPNQIPGFEYDFAMDIFGDWEHWCLLADSDIIREYIQAWRDELTIKLQAKAMSAMMKTALYEGSKGTPAAKFIADRGWEVKRGRPSKAEIERERKIQAGISEEVEQDMKRLGLTIVSGGKS